MQIAELWLIVVATVIATSSRAGSDNMESVEAAPRASVLIESMRDIGYSLQTALADIIDNSLTAGATKIEILTPPDRTHPRIGILDDGEGMTQERLLDAMRLGSRSPLEERARSDLGRFGLGLKTASFSQCRRLTVVTKRAGQTHAAIWDFEQVAKTDKWLVEIPDNPDALPWADRLDEHGTLVIWESLDRLVRDGTEEAFADFVKRMDDARSHLELVFHRFISGELGHKKTQILLNNRPLVAFDPFNSTHSATDHGPIEKIRISDKEVSIQTFTLPHHKKVTTEEWERLAGKDGYVKNQGFYLYRQRRLIIYGTWFGLSRQTELGKLARVKIDMPNGLDAEWKIDVKKASAQPPFQVRERLRRIIEAMGANSRRIYTVRGKRLVSDNRLPVWNRIQDKGQIMYRINADYPLLAQFRSQLAPDLQKRFGEILEVAGAALPMDSLFADLGGEPDKIGGSKVSDEALKQAAISTIEQLRGSGIATGEIKQMLPFVEPFRSNWERAEPLIGSLYGNGEENVASQSKS